MLLNANEWLGQCYLNQQGIKATLVNWFNIYTQQHFKRVKNSLPYIILTKKNNVI
jgi:hypothetical protein